MLQMSSTDIDNAHDVFCKHMGIPPEKWRSVFEFSAYVGFWCINCCKAPVRRGGALKVPPGAQRLFEQLAGPHSRTIVLAHKHRRTTVWGRASTFTIKLAHATTFCLMVPVGIILEIFNLQD